MDYRILGPLEVAEDDREVELGRGRQRSLLALLLLHANEVVSTERLIDDLWGETPPPTAAKTVQVYVSQLRKGLRNGNADGPLLTRGSGYVIQIEPGELDLHRFERALAEGRQALDADAPDAAAEKLREGLALWRGPPLADFAYEPFAQTEIARLEQLRLTALEQRIEADLELGRHAEVVGELEALVAEHPLREGLRAQLMLALYRCDRQAEALAAYRLGRRMLVEELGIEPSSSLRQLHEGILAQEPSLGAPARPRRPPRAKRRAAEAPTRVTRRPRALVAAGAALVAVAASVAVFEIVRADSGPEPPAVPLDYSALAAVATSGAVDAAVALPGVGRVAVTDGLVWVGGDDSRTVSAIDAQTHRLVRTVPIRVFPSDIAAGAGSLWVVDGSRGRVVRIQPSYGEILATSRFAPSGEAPADWFGFDPTAIAADEDGVWITDGSERLMRIDPSNPGAVERIPVGRPLVGVTTGAGGVWAISGERAEVLRIDPRTREGTMRLPIVAAPQLASAFPRAVAAGGDVVWVLNSNTGAVTKIDSRTRSIVGTITVGVERVPVQLAADAHALWVANEDGTLARIDAVTDEVRFYPVGRMLRDVAVGGGAVWASNRLGDCCGQEQ
jgi:DNA-binding SARP family transcriptional activator/DNA-binding beta-propeller fold protein YncE